MIQETNDCVGCATEGYRCLGDICSYRHTKHYICDMCGQEIDPEYESLYKFDGEELCLDCLIEKIPKVRKEDF